MLRIIVTLIYLMAANHVLADWEMVKRASSFSFGTVKNKTVSELHQFTEFRGLVQNNGAARFEIDLLSVDTGIKIRDERMRNILFFDSTRAVYRVNMDMQRITNIPTGESIELDLDGSLELNGSSGEIPLRVRVTNLKSGTFQVEAIAANTIDVSGFGFVEGIEILRLVAGLKAISLMVTLEFKLVFEPLQDQHTLPN